MKTKRPLRTASLLPLALLLTVVPLRAQDRLPDVTTPEEFLGFEIGADYHLATYEQLQAYWERLASESDRMVLRSIGETADGRPQLQAIITSPENHANLDRYRTIAARLARAEGVSESEARALADEGRAVVWIDGGLHATEVLGAQQLMQLVYDMVSRTDDETLRFLDDVVLLATHANPDGHALVANWYMRTEDPEARTTRDIPVLYEKYAGHDNNRDFYMVALPETRNMNRVMYTEWYPQIVYNHHQTGPAGTVMFAPPFRDPPNHNLDPMILTSLDQVGSAMHQRFVVEGKGGTTMRSGASYSTWWNGGLRTTPYYHNMIGLLTETIGHPTPMEVPFLPEKQITRGDLPLPVEPGPWHFEQSIDYSQTANRAVLDYASRNREHLLFNIWRMGTNSIERGSRDSWTVLPDEIEAAAAAVDGRGTRADWERLLHAPADRDARGYVVPSDQPDFITATKFVETLLMNGVEVHRATAPFTAGGTRYPEGSYVVRTDQAFRPHVLDMFEPQNHPDDFAYPGAPPTAPYDNAGWTLAYQMDVEFDRILDDFQGPFEPIDAFTLEPEPGEVAGSGNAGWLLDHRVNDAFRVVNRVLADGGGVFWMKQPVEAGGTSFPAGAFFLPASGTDRGDAEALARETGVDFHAVAARPAGPALELHAVRIGLWDEYGGSMESGWTRYVLERFGFDFDVVYPPDLDRGDLRERYDVLIFPDDAIPEEDRSGGDSWRAGREPRQADPDIPAEYRDRVGRTTVETTVPEILEFVRDGGTAVTWGGSTVLGTHAGLPIENHLVGADGEPLASEEYYVPGSVLDVKLEHVSPLTHGMGERADVLFSRSPVFDVAPGATNVKRIGWFDTEDPLRSGWAWGQHHLQGGATLLEADVGQGKLFMFGPTITFRAQSHGTFPLLFNAIYYGPATDVADVTQDDGEAAGG